MIDPPFGVWEVGSFMLCLVERPYGVRLYGRERLNGEVVVADQVLPAAVLENLEWDAESFVIGRPEGPLRLFRSGVKQVLVYRRDLRMRKGKIAAQCAHASLAVFLRRSQSSDGVLSVGLDGPMEHWLRSGTTKVVLSVDGEEELLGIEALARKEGLPVALITDAGRTEFKGVPTRTAVAVGPAGIQEIDRITGKGGAFACRLA